MISYGFYFSATPGDSVRDGEIRFDAAAPFVGRVTRLYVDNLDREGQIVRQVVTAYAPGTTIYVESPSGARFASFRMLRAVVARSGLVEIPVLCLAGSPEGILPGPVDVAFMRGDPMGRDAATDPDLVTLAVAKQHLRITDVDHDADVQQKLTAASATIRDYLKDRNDPTWTASTAPPWIVSSVLLLLAHLYEHRGDEFGGSQDNDDRVWSAIANLCARSRAPTIQ